VGVALLSMKEVFSDLVSAGTARDDYRDYRTGPVFLKNRISVFLNAGA
jgi:hypothetical protein